MFEPDLNLFKLQGSSKANCGCPKHSIKGKNCSTRRTFETKRPETCKSSLSLTDQINHCLTGY
jgi:hypothetical protein